MLSPHLESNYVDKRIDHDSFAPVGTKGIISIEERPMQITIPENAWPAGLKPVVQKISNHSPGSRINGPVGETCDTLIITYTTDETRALSYVFTGDVHFEDSWYKYCHGFDKIKPKITNGLELKGKPTTLGSGILGFLLPVKIGNQKAVLYKSELHPARNGKELPILDMVQQLVNDLSPKLVITSGTGGAVGKKVQLGDAVITGSALFLCKHQYPDDSNINSMSKNKEAITNDVSVANKYIDYANEKLTLLISPGLLSDIEKLKSKFQIDWVKNNDSPKIYSKNVPSAVNMNVISADYFSIDDSKDTEGLQEMGVMNDMDDAFVAFAINQIKGSKPQWLSIRNASEPEIKFQDDEKAMKDNASNIYDICGYHTSFSSSFASWAVIAGMQN